MQMPSQVEVSIQAVDGGLNATVRDDGNGFDTGGSAPRAASLGMGLLSMQERAELLGGNLSVLSSPDAGCQVILHIPSEEA